MNFMQRLAAELDRLQAPAASELLAALRHADCHPKEIGLYALDPIPGMSYGRNVVYRSNDVEAIVIHLPAGARTSIHNHGDSIGCAQVVEGRLSNVVYRAKGFGMACETGKIDVRTGSFFAAPHGQIHQLRNDGEERAVSLHLYAPPLRGMRTYRPEEKVSLDFVI
jgi:cysteine dioxygenase